MFSSPLVRCSSATPKSVSLPVDYFRCCSNRLGVRFHRPLLIGIRTSQVRGLFAADGHDIPANSPVATIPLASVITGKSMASGEFGMPEITPEIIASHIADEEIRLLAPHIHLGLQFASAINYIPGRTAVETSDPELASLLVEDVMPICRMIDDEDFNEEFLFRMYGATLDTWQKAGFTEMTDKFNKAMTDLHTALKLPFSIRHLRRICRLILARTEHVPRPDQFEGSIWVRRVRRLLATVLKQTPPTDVAVIPVLDLVNHSNRPNLGVRLGPSPLLDGRAAVTLHTLMPVKGGQELCRHYNFALSRQAALFRYGFLPFDLIAVEELSAINEHLVKNRELSPESDEIIAQRTKEMEEIHRLEGLFKHGPSN